MQDRRDKFDPSRKRLILVSTKNALQKKKYALSLLEMSSQFVDFKRRARPEIMQLFGQEQELSTRESTSVVSKSLAEKGTCKPESQDDSSIELDIQPSQVSQQA